MIPIKPILKIGRAHFLCGYYLRNLPAPEIETCIYIGTNIFEGDHSEKEPHHYFECPNIYFAEKISEENAKFHDQETKEEQSEQPLQSRLRVADSELEALVYDYHGLREWVIALREEPYADKAF